ncbi:MAG: TaqI-like C-terminal specificity domain-containing protein [Kiritimatiellales bacterium]
MDIDNQAVEVAQLSLYLKLLEEETTATARGYQLEFHETILPSLNKNIVCGNSLIGTDIETGQLFASDEERKLNPMDYKQRFPEIMKRGGFDAIVGNPPWGALFNEIEKVYLAAHYVSKKGEAESYIYFIEKAFRLIKDFGCVGYITPNTWLALLRSREIREFLLDQSRFSELCQLSKYIFRDAPDIVPALVFFGKPFKAGNKCLVKTTKELKIHDGNFNNAFKIKETPQAIWLKTQGSTINLELDDSVLGVIEKCRQSSVRLGNVCDVLYGIKTGDNEKFLTKEKTAKHTVKALKTGELSRYGLTWKNFYLWWSDQLAGYRESNLEVPKIIVQYIRKISLPRRIIAALDEHGEYYPLNNYSYIAAGSSKYSIKFILGVLNSGLMNFYYANTFIDYNIKPTYLQSLPIRECNFSIPSDKARHNKMVSLVEQMLTAKKQLAAAQSDKDKNFYGHKCESLDRQIDTLVYELYGLTEAEIAIVEGNS